MTERLAEKAATDIHQPLDPKDATPVNVSQQEVSPVTNEVAVSRRRFSAAYKKKIVAEAERCGHGELGLLLRREGLYRGTVDVWRKVAQKRGTEGFEAPKRGRKPKHVNPLREEINRLKQELERERKAQVSAEAIVEVQKSIRDAGLDARPGSARMAAAQQMSPSVGIAAACASMGVSRATEFRSRHPAVRKEIATLHPRALSAQECQSVLNTLTSKRFINWAPAAVYAALLDERVYKCSTSTMSRILHCQQSSEGASGASSPRPLHSPAAVGTQTE